MNRKVPSTQLIWMGPNDPRPLVLSRRGYHQWWLMGATLIFKNPELVSVLTGTNFPISKRWKAELA